MLKLSKTQYKQLCADCAAEMMRGAGHGGKIPGASDYTQHRDPVRKQQYLARHAPREDWDNPMTAGALARWILWNKETLHSSIQDYTRRFNLAAV